MKENFDLQHRLALDDPYHSIIKVLQPDPDRILVGIKNVAGIPNTLMHKLEKYGFGLHTIDKKSQLAGRAVDTELINPITGHYMSGSSSGTALNVFAGINDLGIGTDGGGSVLAPAMCVNVIGFISRLIEQDRIQNLAPNTDGITSANSIGFITRHRDLLLKAIKASIGIEPADDYGVVLGDKVYGNLKMNTTEVMECHTPRKELTAFLQEKLKSCDVLIVTEGPVDLEGFGDSLFGHFDERTKAIQNAANKGYVRVCNIAGATALSLPQQGLGMSTLLMCESTPEKIGRLLCAMNHIEEVRDELIERYFLNLENYYNEGYQI